MGFLRQPFSINKKHQPRLRHDIAAIPAAALRLQAIIVLISFAVCSRLI
jgi:hypothetical protein